MAGGSRMLREKTLNRQLLQARTKLSEMRVQSACLRASRALERRYDPGQAREPAGSPSGGQWSGGAGRNSAPGHLREIAPDAERSRVDPRAGRITLAARRKVDECAIQYERDLFQCRLVAIRSCYAQAKVRQVAC